MTESFTLPAFAKINLFLHIHGRREDGYHELCTVFQTISLHDSLTFGQSDDNAIHLTCNDPSVPTGEKNLIAAAASLLKKEFNIDKGANIHLSKRIPSPGGLGGGSSDAAITFIGLIRLWQLNIEFAQLKDLCQEVGSDVAFFLYGGTALGAGRGGDITPLADFRGDKLLVVTPRINVATADAYSLLSLPSLTIADSNRILKICHNEAERLLSEQSELRNDFEGVVFKSKPELARAKDSLLELKAVNVLMSGSGASFFASFADEAARQNAFATLKQETDWQVFEVETVSRRRYLDSLGACSDILQQ
ncbi:MAG TPA: 4-(cytidine 5'-diphospho)-2-C-methyl-D-erythritol kinase [Pyrinomonadaceae bacterium]|jgi:4-diphosphocytidyl-2-C-methyl-D-erythritol kinase|nr:4-(cytidine 5'-diphospho)-2-C-methyl-D-erythritol kinase [Pyrinomonadaceae bacterium]